jgi:hypothetical protein
MPPVSYSIEVRFVGVFEILHGADCADVVPANKKTSSEKKIAAMATFIVICSD